MPGTFVFKPLEAKLTSENDFFGTMDPYCTVVLGDYQSRGATSHGGGKNPRWSDSIVMKRTYEPDCTIEIRNKELSSLDSTIGTVKIDLQEVEQNKRVTKWYQVLAQGDKPAGEILIETIFAPDTQGSYKQTACQQKYAQPPSPKTFHQSLYPVDLYSPAKQHLLRPISQMAVPSTNSSLSYTPQVTHAHISHHLTSEEYGKLHGRQNERYQPTTSVIGTQEVPPSWDGYEAPYRSPVKEANSNSTKANTPSMAEKDSEGLTTKGVENQNWSFYPNIGGIRYGPSASGQKYQAMFPIEEQDVSTKQTLKSTETIKALDEKIAPTNLASKFDDMKLETGSLEDRENRKPDENTQSTKRLSTGGEKNVNKSLGSKVPFGEVKNILA